GDEPEDRPQAPPDPQERRPAGRLQGQGDGDASRSGEGDHPVLAGHGRRVGVAVALEEEGPAGGGGDQVLIEHPAGGGRGRGGAPEAGAPQELVGDARRRRGEGDAPQRELAPGRRRGPPAAAPSVGGTAAVEDPPSVTTITPFILLCRSQT